MVLSIKMVEKKKTIKPTAKKAPAKKTTEAKLEKPAVKPVAKKAVPEKAKVTSCAVIKTGGKQYLVKPTDVIEIELISDKKAGDEIIFDQVLLREIADRIEIGTPYISEAKVKAKVLAETKGDKEIVFKYKAKKNYRVKTGHRQKYLKVEITEI